MQQFGTGIAVQLIFLRLTALHHHLCRGENSNGIASILLDPVDPLSKARAIAKRREASGFF